MTKPDRPQSGAMANAGNLLAQPYVLLVLAPFLWACNTVAGKLAVGEIDPLIQVQFRFILAFLLVLPFAWRHLRVDWKAILPALPLLAFYGAFGYATFNYLMFLAPHTTSAVNMSIEQAVIPILVMVGNFIVFRVRAQVLQVVGVILTIWGVVFVATHGDVSRLFDMTVNIGDLYVVAACTLYSVYSLVLKYRPPIHWLSFLAVTFGFAAITALATRMLFGGGLDAFMAELPNTTTTGWLIVVFAAVFPSITSQLCYAMGVSMIGPNRASLFINLIPVFGTVMSVIILAEGLETFHLIAAAFVITGIMLAEWSARRRPVEGL